MIQLRQTKRRGHGPTAILLLAPLLLAGTLFYLLPILISGLLSFTNWNPLAHTRWIGLENYRFLLELDPILPRSLVNTFVFAFGGAAIAIPLAVLVAHAMTGARGIAIWRCIFWLPMVTNVVAVAFAWDILLHPAYGLINRVLNLAGLPGPGWLTDPATAMVALLMVNTWMNVGQNVVLVLAGMEAIDPALYEAARLDGARERELFWRITLPLLRPALFFVTVMNVISGFGAFALVLVLTNGGPQRSTEVTALYLYQLAFEDLRMGRACAVAYVLMALLLLVTLLLGRLFRGDGRETA